MVVCSVDVGVDSTLLSDLGTAEAVWEKCRRHIGKSTLVMWGIAHQYIVRQPAAVKAQKVILTSSLQWWILKRFHTIHLKNRHVADRLVILCNCVCLYTVLKLHLHHN